MLRFWPLLFLLLAFGSWNTYTPGGTNDDTSYLALSRSLSQGQAYLDLAIAGHPPHQRFPPGYPLLLLPLRLIWPYNYDVCRILGVGFSVVAAWAMMTYARRLAEELPGVWRWAPLLTLCNPFWLFHTTMIMSEQPFLVGLFAILWFWDRQVRVEKPTVRTFFYLGLALGLLTILRVVAVCLVAALGLHALWRWRWRCLRLAPALATGFALTAGPCLLRAVLTGYDNQAAGVVSHPGLTLLQSLRVFPSTAGLLMLTGFRWIPDALPLWLGLLPFGLGLYGLWRLRARPLLLGWVLAGFGMLMGWPFTQHPRLLLPFLPFLQIGLWVQLGAVRRPAVRLAFWVLVLANVVASVVDGWQAVPLVKDDGILALLRSQKPGTVISARDQSWWLSTELPINPVQQMQAVEREWTWLEDLSDHRVSLVVVEGLHETDSQILQRHFQRRGQLYKEVLRGPDAVVFRFQPDAAWRQSFRWQRLARSALSMGRFDWATHLFERAVQADPHEISAASGLAYALAAQGQTQRAGQLATAVLGADPECGEAFRVQAFVRQLQ